MGSATEHPHKVPRVARLVPVALALVLPAVALAGEDLGSAGGVSYIRDSASPDPPATAVLEAACPAGKEVSGGGFDASVAGELNDTAPADGPDAGDDPDDAWFVTIEFAPTGFEPEVEAYAMCEARSHRTEVEADPIAAGETAKVSVPCPGRTKPTGGGVSLSGEAGRGTRELLLPVRRRRCR